VRCLLEDPAPPHPGRATAANIMIARHAAFDSPDRLTIRARIRTEKRQPRPALTALRRDAVSRLRRHSKLRSLFPPDAKPAPHGPGRRSRALENPDRTATPGKTQPAQDHPTRHTPPPSALAAHRRHRSPKDQTSHRPHLTRHTLSGVASRELGCCAFAVPSNRYVPERTIRRVVPEAPSAEVNLTYRLPRLRLVGLPQQHGSLGALATAHEPHGYPTNRTHRTLCVMTALPAR
jgi:hypothetical protein